MKTLEYRFWDKAKWGEGPWQSEPDKVQYQDAATGLPALIVRGPAGALCGYVGITANHPLFGVSYHDCVQGCEEDAWCGHSPESTVRVHGGLTFSDSCREDPEHHGICHIPDAGEPDRVWWFGFDCAHSGDYSPAYGYRFPLGHDSYKDIAYVKAEIADLALQLVEAAHR